ncbi:hypothetical protein JTB14_019112 [Gonioctena quinquepunctata]|nr:hypothetical protein JTB14_019112 [Gonioctena quinquepunctata]
MEGWTTWKSLNRLHSGVTRSKEDMRRWGLSNEPALCDCEHTQTTTHLMQCELCPNTCTMEDLVNATPEALDVAKFWSKTS